MKFWSKLSIKVKLIAMTSAIIMSLVVGGLYEANKLVEAAKQKIAESLSNVAEEVNKAIQAQFFERYSDVQAFAGNDVVRSLNKDRIPEALDFYTQLYGIYDLILVVDAQGNYVASNTRDIQGNEVDRKKLAQVDFSKASWFQSVMKGQFTSQADRGLEGTYVEFYGLDSWQELAFGKETFGTGFSAPIKDSNGRVVGVITNRANPKWIDDVFKDVYTSLQAYDYKSASALLVDDTGTLLFEHDPSVNTNGKNEIFRNLDIVLKMNFIQSGYEPIIRAVKGERGVMSAYHTGRKTQQLVAFEPLDGPKFVSSIPANIVVRADEDEVYAKHNAVIRNMVIVFAIMGLLALALAVWFSSVMSKSIMVTVTDLLKASNELTDASSKIAAQSTELSEAATEQAAAIQETMSAVDEIGATVEKNAESAQKSKMVSSYSRQSAEKGKSEMENMMEAISQISQSNEELASRMNESTKQISEIVRLINEIGNKTKVINEIVFQTKLLSFNASVEAARAGEYGKGFAVVAEEVGNLAQMSGNAAKEISEMLENSIRQVEKIVSETQGQITGLVSNSKSKIEYGIETARSCETALDDILKNAAEVDALINEIAQASTEQANGIREISKAVGQLDVVTQQNTAVSQQSSAAAEQLSVQAVDLNEVVNTLKSLVQGKDSHAKSQEQRSARSERKPHGSGRVLAMKKKEKYSSPASPLKKAAGLDIEVPDANDPRFEDV